MYRIQILEDDLAAAETLLSCLRRYGDSHSIAFEAMHFSNALEFLERYSGNADLIFFDIEMPGLNGMEAAKQIREIDPNVTIVFVTNLAQFAIEGYSVHALDLILKPYNYAAMEKKFDRIFTELSHKNKGETITVNRKDGVQLLNVEDIRYVEIKNHSLIYHLGERTVNTWGSLANASEKLILYHFSFASASSIPSFTTTR